MKRNTHRWFTCNQDKIIPFTQLLFRYKESFPVNSFDPVPDNTFTNLFTDRKTNTVKEQSVRAVIKDDIARYNRPTVAVNPLKVPIFFKSEESHIGLLQALNFFLLFCLLLLITCLPAWLLILLKKPWTLFLVLFFGWYVLFIFAPLSITLNVKKVYSNKSKRVKDNGKKYR